MEPGFCGSSARPSTWCSIAFPGALAGSSCRGWKFRWRLNGRRRQNPEVTLATWNSSWHWFARVLDTRFKLYFNEPTELLETSYEMRASVAAGRDSDYARFLRHYELGFAERLAVVLAPGAARTSPIARHLLRTQQNLRPEIHRVRRHRDKAPIPTSFRPSRPWPFCWAANDLEVRFSVMRMFDPAALLCASQYPSRSRRSLADDPLLRAPLSVGEECLGLFTTGRVRRPDFRRRLSGPVIETELTWDDLVLHPATRTQMEEIETWIQHGATLMNDWGMAAKLRPGFRSPLPRTSRVPARR